MDPIENGEGIIKDKDYMNIGISLKAYAFSHMMPEKLGSKSTQSLYTFIQSEVQKMTKLKLKKWQNDKVQTRGPWWSYIAHLSKQICILTVEHSAKFTDLRFMYKFYTHPP